jgi:hypothetical protein
MSSPLEETLQNCNMLYNPSATQQQKTDADTWLKAFVGEHEAWSVATQLLAGDYPEHALFYGALLLHSKVI